MPEAGSVTTGVSIYYVYILCVYISNTHTDAPGILPIKQSHGRRVKEEVLSLPQDPGYMLIIYMRRFKDMRSRCIELKWREQLH